MKVRYQTLVSEIYAFSFNSLFFAFYILWRFDISFLFNSFVPFIQNDIEAAREAYDAFLAHYPYCYGYWRKYADYEKRKGNKKKCEEVCPFPEYNLNSIFIRATILQQHKT